MKHIKYLFLTVITILSIFFGLNQTYAIPMYSTVACGTLAGGSTTPKPHAFIGEYCSEFNLNASNPAPASIEGLYVDAQGYENWTCVMDFGTNWNTGQINRDEISCKAIEKTVVAVNGSCGGSNGGTFSSKPTTNLCTEGTASNVSGSGPWTWSCSGSNGGTTASCSASKAVSQYTVTATAGAGGIVSPTTQQVTSGGSATITATPNTGYTFNGWSGCTSVSGTTCTVSNVTSNKTVTASFSANPTPVNGVCGYPNGEEVASKPGLAINDDLCTKGTATSVIGSGPWYWSCNGKNGGTTANCSATTVITPTCGVNNKNYAYNATGFVSPTTTGFCAAGPLGVLPGQIAFPSQGGTTYWQCGNGGIMGGGNIVSCSATRDSPPSAPTINGACGTASKTYPSAAVGYGTDTFCASGSSSPTNPAFPSSGESIPWTCAGSGGGTTAQCSAARQTGVYTIVFDARGGSIPPNGTYLPGAPLGDLPTSYWEGHQFIGWFTQISGGIQVTPSYIVNASQTLYAHWSDQNLTVTFDGNGGSGHSPTSRNNIPYNGSIGPLPSAPTKADATFEGWFTSPSGGSEIYSTTTITQDTIFYAHWSINLDRALNGAYANSIDKNYIQLSLLGSTEENKPVVFTGKPAANFGDFTDTWKYESNPFAPIGSQHALKVIPDTLVLGSVAPNSVVASIPVTSVTPMKVQDRGTISFEAGGTLLNITNIDYHFKKPYIGMLQKYDFVTNSYSSTAKPTIGTLEKYKLQASKPSALTLSASDLSITLDTGSIKPITSDLSIQSPKIYTGSLGPQKEFEARINASQTSTGLYNTPGLKLDLPKILYTLDGRITSYELSKGDEGDDRDAIEITGDVFKKIKIIGGLQGNGKQEITGQKSNISNLYTFTQRTEIRKNAYVYTKSMTSGQVVGGIRYVNGSDVTLNSNADVSGYNTLVVINGNVNITGNITPSDLFGIIVLQDKYDVTKDIDKQKGNIFITPNVTKINSVIYADGGIVAAYKDGMSILPYKTDSIERTENLQKQLTIIGSVFTRNTIGGAVYTGGNYLLPGGGSTNDFDKAMIYDFNYLRRGNEGCDLNTNGSCEDSGEYVEPFVLQYDSRIQKHPLRLFQVGQ